MLVHKAKPGRIGVILLGTMAALLLLSGPAWAHVVIVPDSAPGGSSGAFSFHVPNERADASTNKIEVIFPREYPITSVTVQPVAGWRTTVHTVPLDPAVPTGAVAVGSIRWEDGDLGPAETGQFPVLMGPLPDSGQLVFKVLQTYSDGTVQRWIEAPDASGVESDHAAPVLTVGSADEPGAQTPGAQTPGAQTPDAPAPGALGPGAPGLPASPPAVSGSAVSGSAGPGSGDASGAGRGLVLSGGIALTGLLAVAVGLLYRRAGHRSTRPAGPPEREPADLTRG